VEVVQENFNRTTIPSLRPLRGECLADLACHVHVFAPTFAITGNEKRGDEGATLFAVRVDGVVGRLNHF